jgi:hypothetical protein
LQHSLFTQNFGLLFTPLLNPNTAFLDLDYKILPYRSRRRSNKRREEQFRSFLSLVDESQHLILYSDDNVMTYINQRRPIDGLVRTVLGPSTRSLGPTKTVAWYSVHPLSCQDVAGCEDMRIGVQRLFSVEGLHTSRIGMVSLIEVTAMGFG